MPHNKKKKNHQHGKKGHNSSVQTKNTDDVENQAAQNETNALPYEIQISEVIGRYLIASKSMKAGEMIINEVPLAIGPPSDYGPVCLGCYQKVTFSKSQYRCPECHWPICSQKCEGLKTEHGHSTRECEILSEKKIAQIIENYNENKMKVAYEIMLHLRCLLLKQTNPTKWEKLMEMESHNEVRKGVPLLWLRNQTQIVNQIREDWNIKDFSEDEIHTVCGIIEVNCFEVGQQGAKGRALYPSAFLLSHDCSPNTTHTDHLGTYAMAVRAIRDLKQGETITLNYGYIFMGTLKRRDNLKEGKFFWCTCRRCSDPTEFGTYCSAMRCPKCSNGVVLPTDPLNQKAPWKCHKCEYSAPAEAMSSMLDKLFKELDSVDPHEIVGQEKFIQKYEKVLTKNHYLVLSAKYPLCQLYGRSEGFLIDTLSDALLKHKERYCRDILKVINVLEPGLSRVKGIIMYELHAPLMIMTGKMFENKQITTNEFRCRLQEVVSLLRESEQILRMEPEGSKEQDMANAAKEALAKIKSQNILKFM